MLNIIPIAVNRQNIVCNSIRVASDLIAEVRCDFTLSAEWAEFQTVSAIFEDKYGTKIETVISNGSCLVPHEVLQHRGAVKVNLCGYKIAGETKTLQLTSFKTVIIDVLQAVNTSGDNSTEPTAPAWQQQLALRPTDAPYDGKRYARKDGEWEEVDDTTDWDSITGKPSTYPPSAHTHSYESITGKPSTYPPSAHTHSYESITGKPDTFPPSAHEHTVSDISDFPSIPTDNIELANGAGYITDEALEPTKRSLDALWKLNKGQTWDIEEKSENGMNDAPSGAKWVSVEEVHGKSTQGGTNGYQLIPFPYYSQSKTVNGITFTVNADGSIAVKGTATVQTDFWIWFSLLDSVEDNEGVTVTCGGIVSGVTLEGWASTWSSFFASGSALRLSVGYESASGKIRSANCMLTLRVAKEIAVDTVVYPMLEKGSVAHDYEPYTGGIASPNPDYPQEITLVENPVVKVVGKNFNANERVEPAQRSKMIYIPKGTYTFSTSDGSALGSENSFYIMLYNADGDVIGEPNHIKLDDVYMSFSTNSNSYFGGTGKSHFKLYFDDSYYVKWGFSYMIPNISGYQIERGSTATGYVPYEEPTEITIPGTYRSVGTVHDSIVVNDDGTAKKVQTVGSVDLGSLTWTRYTPNNGANYLFYGDVSDGAYGREVYSNNLMCDRYNNPSATSVSAIVFVSMSDYIVCRNTNANQCRLLVRHDSITDAAAFKSAVNGVMLAYELAIPTETALETDLSALLDAPTDKHISVTDSNGNDVPWLAQYIIKLDEVTG